MSYAGTRLNRTIEGRSIIWVEMIYGRIAEMNHPNQRINGVDTMVNVKLRKDAPA
jgi:hypothetical protein